VIDAGSIKREMMMLGLSSWRNRSRQRKKDLAGNKMEENPRAAATEGGKKEAAHEMGQEREKRSEEKQAIKKRELSAC
jgi:hypothetical protein